MIKEDEGEGGSTFRNFYRCAHAATSGRTYGRANVMTIAPDAVRATCRHTKVKMRRRSERSRTPRGSCGARWCWCYCADKACSAAICFRNASVATFVESRRPPNGLKSLVELRGFEPLTSAVRLRRSPN